MKIAFTFFFLFLLLADFLLPCNTMPDLVLHSSPKEVVIIEASVDRQIAYLIVTASLLGIVKLKKNHG
jgi:hypothetical protein